MNNDIKIESGKRRQFSTGAERQSSEGKGTPVLVPGDAIIDIAILFEKGASVYGARNWEKGLPLSEILNSLERHLQAEKMGRTDENHSRALAWNAVIYLATKLRVREGLLPQELDDMPNYGKDAAAIEESIAPPFKWGDRVRIDLRADAPGWLEERSRTANYEGIYGFGGDVPPYDHTVNVDGAGLYFYDDEITLLEDN